MKKILWYVYIFLNLLLLIGCNKVKEDMTLCSYEPFITTVDNYNVERTFDVTIYHSKEIVKRIIVEEKYSADEKNQNALKLIADNAKEVYENEIFNYEGFSFTHEIIDSTLIITVKLDFTQIDMKALSEKDDQFTNARDVINEKYEVVYEKLIKIYKEMGMACEEIN